MFDHLCGIIDCYSAVVVSDQLSSSFVSLFGGRVVDELYKQACYQCNKGELNDAVSTFSQVLKLQPNHAKAYLARGVTYVQLEHGASAIADYRQALKLDPDWANAWVMWGTVLLQPNHYSDAISSFFPGNPLTTRLAKCLRRLWLCLLQSRKFSYRDRFAQAIRLAPTSGQAFLLRGAAREQMQDSEGSMQDINHAKELYQQQDNEAGYQALLQELRGLLKETNDTISEHSKC